MSTTTQPDAVAALAITAAEVAQLLGISERHVWSLLSSGSLPEPIRLGRSTRWRLREVESWLAAGCPSRDERKRPTAD